MKLRMLSLALLITVAQISNMDGYRFSVMNSSTLFKISGAVVEMTPGSGCQNLYMQEPPNGPSPLMPGQSWSDSKSGYCQLIGVNPSVLLRIGGKDTTGQQAYWYAVGSVAILGDVEVVVTDNQVSITTGGLGGKTFTFSLDASGKPSGNVSGPA